MNPVYFHRKPYQVVYKDLHTDELVRVQRRPPPKQHDLLPTDVVSLKHHHGEAWQAGDEVKIKHISYRAPNTLQLINDKQETTFVTHHDVELEEKVVQTPEESRQSRVYANRYLRWP